MARRKMSFPEYHYLERALILIERVTEYRCNLLCDYSFTNSMVDQLVAMECEHELKSLYELKNILMDLLPPRSKVNMEEFEKNCAERRKYWDEIKEKKL